MSERDGGPAFPHMVRHVGPNIVQRVTEDGMTLRDWFAGQALAAQIANPNWPPNPLPAREENAAAHWAYEFADAMLAEREERATNEAVRVCPDHTDEIVAGGGCLLCENERLRGLLDGARDAIDRPQHDPTALLFEIDRALEPETEG